jgi:hypothetical protein
MLILLKLFSPFYNSRAAYTDIKNKMPLISAQLKYRASCTVPLFCWHHAAEITRRPAVIAEDHPAKYQHRCKNGERSNGR